MQTLRELWCKLVRDETCIRDPAAQAPPDIIQLSDHGIRLIFGKTIDWDLCIAIFDHGFWIVALRGVPKVDGFDFDRYLAKVDVAVLCIQIKRIGPVDVRTGGCDQRQIEHRQSSSHRRERSVNVSDKRVTAQVFVYAPFREP